ncbi:MAG: trypsin-like peptidase domain-containing protein, partial [Armatimonadetes bacterium]|nr:trypsin-like peptidase domain-containing protein [Armatimonadota bacterium]
AEVLQKIKDAVVLVEVHLQGDAGELSGTGSGFVVTNTGRIITNSHVVRNWTQQDDGSVTIYDQRSINVVFHANTADEKSYPAQVVRENHEVDLALLRIDAETPVFLTLADSDKVVETTPIMACGHPLGFPEISLRTGTVTAHRHWEGEEWIEHDAEADEGNSGGPVVNMKGEVLGVHTWTAISRNMSSKMAIPSNVVRQWLASDPSEDPAPPQPGGALRELFASSGLKFTGPEDGVFTVPYDNDIDVFVHTVEDTLARFVVPLGAFDGARAMDALHFNYSDPVGRLSLGPDDELYWEAQVPLSFVSGSYISSVCNIAANQAARWAQIVAGSEPEEPLDLYPGGDEEALTAKLKRVLDASDLKYTEEDGTFKMAFDNDVNVYVNIYRGVAYVHSFTGGMPGEGEQGMRQTALELLRRNWDDPLGRLSLDNYNDLAWESQIPMDFLTADYLEITAGIAASQVEKFWEDYGQVPFNEDLSGE